MALPLIDLRGEPYAQGLAHGQALRELILHNLAVYFARFERELKLERAEVLARAGRYATAIARQSPAYVAGMRGIAEGSGAAYEAIVALNVRYELFYHQFGAQAGTDGCTAFAALPEATLSGHLLIGENWDWVAEVRGALVRTSEPDGLVTVSFTEAGIFGGKIGLNSAGVGLAINGLVSNADDWARLLPPFHLRCYEILRTRDIDGAAQIITGTPRACSANFLIAQAPDQVLNIEAAPHSTATSRCANGCLIHANHFVAPAALGVSEPPVEKNAHSYWRHTRLQRLLAAQRPLSLAHIQAALRDHEHHPYSVCFHIDPEEPPEEHYLTLTSVIMDLHTGELLASDGPPCQAEYQRVEV